MGHLKEKKLFSFSREWVRRNTLVFKIHQPKWKRAEATLDNCVLITLSSTHTRIFSAQIFDSERLVRRSFVRSSARLWEIVYFISTCLRITTDRVYVIDLSERPAADVSDQVQLTNLTCGFNLRLIFSRVTSRSRQPVYSNCANLFWVEIHYEAIACMGFQLH